MSIPVAFDRIQSIALPIRFPPQTASRRIAMACMLEGPVSVFRNVAELQQNFLCKTGVFQPVTAFKTFVPCVELKNFATVANGTSFGAGAIMKAMKSDVNVQSNFPAGVKQEVRCAVRFPLALPVTLNIGKSEFPAQTRNVSASGVLFALDRELKVGSDIRFSLRMPGPVLGAAHDILVHCTGRVVRCSLSQHQYFAASTIDDYRFADN